MKIQLKAGAAIGTLLAGVLSSGSARAQNAGLANAPAHSARPAIENSIVKVFASGRYPDVYRPWTKQSPQDVAGSGVVIDGHRILTNAHVVDYASEVQVQANQTGNKVSARVESIAHAIDLAVLKVDDPGFFSGRAAVPCAARLPEIKDNVLTYGYPVGGDTQSVTKGIVSRIEYAPYRFDAANPAAGLRIQVDAAINPGNSGGAAVVDDAMIGITFSVLGRAQNIGYIIPCEEVDLFLKDVADGRYDGKPLLFDQRQTLENAALRSFLKLPPTTEGIVIHRSESPDPAHPLKPWDVISKIGDTPIDNQGMVKLSASTRVSFDYLIQKLSKNGKVPLTIQREGKEFTVDAPVTRRTNVIVDLDGGYPSYFVYGPLVFSTVTTQFVGGFMQQGGGPMALMSFFTGPLMERLLSRPAFPGEQLVVISSPFFPHKLSHGYSNPIGRIVSSVNGIKVKNLRHLVEILRDAKDEFVVVDSEALATEALVFRRIEMMNATEDILTDNGVRTQGSADVLEVWNGRK